MDLTRALQRILIDSVIHKNLAKERRLGKGFWWVVEP